MALLGHIVTNETREKIRNTLRVKNSASGNPMYGRKHAEESKNKNSEAHKGKISPRKGVKLSDETRRKIRESLAATFRKRPTSIERKLYRELSKRNILFEKQKLINNKFTVDTYIPSSNLIIEVDGVYWHGLDKIKKKDKSENAYLLKCGYNLLRISETNMNNNNFKTILDKELE